MLEEWSNLLYYRSRVDIEINVGRACGYVLTYGKEWTRWWGLFSDLLVNDELDFEKDK